MNPKRSQFEQSLVNKAIGVLFSYDEWWLQFFYSHKGGGLRLTPKELIAESRCFSREKQLVIKVALDLWTGGRSTSISKIINILDWESLHRVLLAIMTLREVTIEELDDTRSTYEN